MSAAMEEVIRSPDYATARNRAAAVLADFNLTEPPVNPIEICEAYGVHVVFVIFQDEYQRISGFYDCEEDSIYINEEEAPLRQTFTIAHELGHRLLHREWASSEDYRVLMRDDTEPKDEYELEADEFAASLLMPRSMLDDYVEDVSNFDLSKLFAVSVPEMKKRLSMQYGS